MVDYLYHITIYFAFLFQRSFDIPPYQATAYAFIIELRIWACFFVPYHVSHPTSIADALENLLLNIFRYDRVKLDRISAVNGKLGSRGISCAGGEIVDRIGNIISNRNVT